MNDQHNESEDQTTEGQEPAQESSEPTTVKRNPQGKSFAQRGNEVRK